MGGGAVEVEQDPYESERLRLAIACLPDFGDEKKDKGKGGIWK